MPPRVPLPRLTLFTGGKECSLCEVAKHELSILRRTTPFDLTLWNIRDPPAEVDVKEAKKWRRLYQYDIPVLHLGENRIQKHRIDRTKLQQAIEEWQASQGQVEASPTSEEASKTQFFSVPVENAVDEDDERNHMQHREHREQRRRLDDSGLDESEERQNTNSGGAAADPDRAAKMRPKPWHTYLGRSFFHLPSPVGEYTPEAEWGTFSSLLIDTFRGFSDVAVGSDVEVIDLSRTAEKHGDGEMSFGIDVRPGLVGVEGEGGDVLYDEPMRAEGSRLKHQACWNCLEIGHSFGTCPHPRNPAQIRRSREEHFYAREYLMPETAVPSLALYLSMRVTDAEKERRLELVDMFRPGTISEELEEAVCWVEPDPELDSLGDGTENGGPREERDDRWYEREHAQVKRRRKRWDWYEGIMRWGYPPGFVASKDPIQEVKRRITALQTFDRSFDTAACAEDDLNVYGGNLGTPAPSDDSDDTSSGGGSSSSSLASSALSDIARGGHVAEGSDMDMDMDMDEDEEVVANSYSMAGTPADATPRPYKRKVSSLSPSPHHHDNDGTPPPPPDDEYPLPPLDKAPPPPDDLPPPPPPPEDAPPAPPTTDYPSPVTTPVVVAPTASRTPYGHAYDKYIGTPTPTRQRRSHGVSSYPTPRPSLPSRPANPYLHTPTFQPTSSHPTPRAPDMNGVGPRIGVSPTENKEAYTPRRWAKYHTDLFDSDRLIAYDQSRPLPIGMW